MFGQGNNNGPQFRPRPPAVQSGFPQQPPPNIGVRPFQVGHFPPPPPNLPVNMPPQFGPMPPQFNPNHGHVYRPPMPQNVPIISQGMPHCPQGFLPGPPPLPPRGQGFYGNLPPPPPSFYGNHPFPGFPRGPVSEARPPSTPMSPPPPPPPSSPPPLPPPPPPTVSPLVTRDESSAAKDGGPLEVSPQLVESSSEPVDAKVEVNNSKGSSEMDDLENVDGKVKNSPASSDMDMEDDVSLPTGNKSHEKINREYAEGGNVTSSSSKHTTFPKDVEDGMESSSMEDVSPVRSSSDVQEHSEDNCMQKAAEDPGVFVKDDNPFRLIQGYVSDDSGENDKVVNDDITNPARESNLASVVSSSTQDVVTEVQLKGQPAFCESSSSIPEQSSVRSSLQKFTTPSFASPGTISENWDRVQNSRLSREKDTVECDSIHSGTVGNPWPEEVRKSIGRPNIDEYGRMVREGVSDSDNDSAPYNEKRGKRARSSNRGLSPKDNRHRRRSRSPRRRAKRSQSRSLSPRRSPREARRTDVLARQDRDKPSECLNFVQGRCSDGASCRFVHQDSGQNRGRKYRNQQIQDDSVKHDVQNHALHPERSQMVKKTLVENYESPLREDSVQLDGEASMSVNDRVSPKSLKYSAFADELVQAGKTSKQQTTDQVIDEENHGRGMQETENMSEAAEFEHKMQESKTAEPLNAKTNEIAPALRPPNSSGYTSNVRPFHTTWPNFPIIPQQSNVSDFSGVPVSGMQHHQAQTALFPQPALPSRNEFVQSSGPPFGQFSHSQATDTISQPLHQVGQPRQLPLPVGNQQDQPFYREGWLPLPPKSDAPRSFNPNDQNLPHGDVSGSYPGHGSISFPHGSVIQPHILPPRESFISSQLPADSFSNHQRPSLQQDLATGVFHSNFVLAGKVDSSLQKDRIMLPHLPDIGVTKTSITMHHNPFASTFEQDPSSLKFSSASGRENAVAYNTKYDGPLSSSHNPVSVLSSRLSSSPSRFTKQDEKLLPTLGGVPQEVSQVSFDFLKPKFNQYAAGAPYDPLLDSIEPSSGTVKNLAPPWEQNIPAANAGTLSGSNIFTKTTDAEHSNKKKGNRGDEHNLDPDASDEMASDAEVGIVENESPQLFDGKDDSTDVPADLGNTGAGEIEIDQVLSPGKAKKKRREQRSMKLFKIALADFVKEVLKPSWRQGNMSKEAFKTIVKKTVDKVSGALPSHQVPKSQAKINQYVESSQRKLTKLVMGYVDKYVKM